MPIHKIAISHPGKMGDALHALPSAKELCRRHETTCDFYTSSYCKPMTRLLEYQPYIDKVIIPKSYTIERMDMGVQPWKMPIPDDYKAIYQLGFRSVPNEPIPDFIARNARLPLKLPVGYECPEDFPVPDYPYIVMASRGVTSYSNLFIDIIKRCPIKVVQIGGKGEFIGSPEDSIDMTNTDMLETCTLIANSEAFVGLMSSQLVLANGFPIPKIAPHDGRSWDMRHVVRSPNNFYPINPTAEDVLSLALDKKKKRLIYSKSLNPYDYHLMDEQVHVISIKNILSTTAVRFEHAHRAWEYGIITNALRNYNIHTVLDVGGGGSAFAPAIAYLGMDVTQVDPGNVGHWIKEQQAKLKPIGRMEFVQQFFEDYTGGMFDAVTCISTLEHIEKDKQFFLKLFKHAKEMVAITVDFSEDGKVYTGGHIRTYSGSDMIDLIKLALTEGFVPAGGDWDYSHYDGYVNGYSFASLILTFSKHPHANPLIQ